MTIEITNLWNIFSCPYEPGLTQPLPHLLSSTVPRIAALSGDYCTDPDANAEALIVENADSDTLKELLTYYTGDCTTDNEVVDIIIASQTVAIPIIQETLPILYQAGPPNINR